ncbi:sodium-translocating pyrophosphatase [Actinospica sp. MGRD01-02]|uniref:K(+)-insensitive pyrophosphate-energized proton pump n=1 Tax=Actinospica acidithermotolerans TaxID=2828514 RepID=A0A941E6T2_9ACTN|nr:sodium-translocating pyrophosphatase [Actinospica acidithermotolerans]MBR7826161.1 sodium-translocating pyrophosphatase [Actinospica acidithermotolerans]
MPRLPEPYLADSAPTLTGGNITLVIVVAIVALAALGVAAYLMREVRSASEGTEKMKEIAAAVQEGATAYLARQFRTLSVFAGVAFLLLLALPADNWNERIGRSVFFLLGAGFSAVTGTVGMQLAVRANVRVAAAARESGANRATRIAFRTGGVVGMFTVGLGLFGAAIVVLAYQGEAPKVLEGFGFGAALLAMFMRVGGGIFTKAADVGADLVGKVEQGIPEDDPRNAATIADNVGDNVGDCAGMAADLFESYAVMLVAALILGSAAFGNQGLVFPLLVPMIGVVTAVIGIFAVSPRPGDRSGMQAINRGFFLSAIASVVLVAIAAFTYLPSSMAKLTNATAGGTGNPQVIALVSVIIGIVVAVAIQQLTGYFTDTAFRPVKDVGKTSLTGPATVILSGISLGLESAVYSALLIAAGVFGAYLLGGGSIMLSLFCVAMAGTGLLTTVGVIVAMDTFGPVSDNAQGIAEMSGDVDGEAAQVLTSLDAVGNTTKAITKGIAIATAVLAATALFGSFQNAITEAVAKKQNLNLAPTASNYQYAGILNVADPRNLVGLIIGAAVVFLFSGLAINAVSRAAGAVVFEVRRQFAEIPGIMEGTGRPEYGRVVDIVTTDSLRELITPGLLAVMAPIAVGFSLGVGALGSYLAGAIGCGTLMAVYLANSGGAWDNAKKLVEDGVHGGKGSPAHEATIIGDTVGDPFKDTAGPAINPLIKVMNLVSLLVAPAIVALSLGTGSNPAVRGLIAAAAFVIIVLAVWNSKRKSIAVEAETEVPSQGNAALDHDGAGNAATPA